MKLIDGGGFLGPEYIGIIRAAGNNTARGQQTRIGPSQLGYPCSRRLAGAATGVKQADQLSRWKAQIGTAIHAQLADIFLDHPLNQPPDPRWLVEEEVDVGEIDGEHITGSCDLFDTMAGCVVDWKTTGPRRMQYYARNGPGQQYRVQAHAYGRGWQRRGFEVQTVMLVFLPRDGELETAYIWHEPYDEAVAVAALERAEGLVRMVKAFGLRTVQEMFDPCTDQFCPVCPVRHPYGAPAREFPSTPTVHRTVADLFASASTH